MFLLLMSRNQLQIVTNIQSLEIYLRAATQRNFMKSMYRLFIVIESSVGSTVEPAT
jgi:hypothetical protein